jgi:DNA repair protein RadA/Sms
MSRTAATGRTHAAYRCTECGWQATKWVGRCGECQAWGTVDEVGARLRRVGAAPVTAAAQRIVDIDAVAASARGTGVPELDRVLGGGLVPGSVVLLAGEPGVGKSTLLLEVAAQAARAGRRALYITGEESAVQVRLRADRIGALDVALMLAAETELGSVIAHVEAVEPELLVVDSVQTIANSESDGAAGGVTQVREVASTLIRIAKERQMATVLVGHVTKDGSVAGPRVLEHLVDVVLQFEGDRHSRLRMVRATKNRYGPSDEVGCFDLDERGITGLPDPSGLFLSHGIGPAVGTCVTSTVEGRRALVSEVQALVGPSYLNSPRRATSGLDAARVGMILAVLERRGGLRLGDRDVYVATVGGVRLTEPGTDLAVAMAVASSSLDLPLPLGLIAVGELGLAGEVRRAPGIGARLAEAARLGFTRALVPPDSPAAPAGLDALEIRDLAEALAAVGCPSRTVHSR